MASQPIEQPLSSVTFSPQVIFGGDNVRLAGKIDYPTSTVTGRGYPLIFIIQHATCTTLRGYQHLAKLGVQAGMAVFRWDKRGTGSSGAGGGGSVIVDTLKAYETATTQRGIDPTRVIIAAQNEGTILLSEAYDSFASVQKPLGVLMLGNMLDERQILSIPAPMHIVSSKNDWNAWQIYAKAASEAHAEQYSRNTTYYVAPNTNRRLMYTNTGTFHRGAEKDIHDWLIDICQTS